MNMGMHSRVGSPHHQYMNNMSNMSNVNNMNNVNAMGSMNAMNPMQMSSMGPINGMPYSTSRHHHVSIFG